MKILALEFSSSQRSAAVWPGGGADICEVVDPASGRDMQPFALIESALSRAGLEREAINCIVVGIGPGSYTGIRAAISLAQGWQLAADVELLGISSASCIAAQVAERDARSRISVVIDAQRGEYYLSGYDCAGGVPRELDALHLASKEEVRAREQAGDLLIGPEVTRWFSAGQTVFPQAAVLAKLAARRAGLQTAMALEPIYLRETTFVKASPARVLSFDEGIGGATP